MSRSDEPLTAGSLFWAACCSGTKHRSMLSACPGCSAARTAVLGGPFPPSPVSGHKPAVLRMRFTVLGLTTGTQLLALVSSSAIRCLPPSGCAWRECKHTLLDNEGFRVQLVRNATVERREPGIAFLVEPGFPMVKQASADTVSVTGLRDTARGLPGLKEQLALLRCGKTMGSAKPR